MSSINKQLFTARQGKKLTQRELAERLGWPQSYVSKIETGQLAPRLSNITQMARALDHELILVPREALPAVEGLLSGKSEKPLWNIEEGESDAAK
jgi:transcriptional regulator with XRE-family HTH domain